jgi:hypothetical protein
VEILKYREDLPFYLNSRGLLGKGVEVGVLYAEFSEHILTHWKGEKLYLVDAWRTFPGLVDVNNPDENGQLNNMGMAVKRIYRFEERATVIREPSLSASSLFQNDSLDFVYLDAAHDYKNVTFDIMTWLPKVKPGGILAGHDYLDLQPTEINPTLFEVKSAVDSFFKDRTVHSTQEDPKDFPSWWVIK